MDCTSAVAAAPLKVGVMFLVFLTLGFHSIFAQTATYNTSGSYTWVCPAGVTSVSVQAWGGGGAGGAATNNTVGGGGGGGGAYNSAVIIVTPGQSYSIVVGAGGVAVTSSNGGNGGNSSFNTTSVLANGGAGGLLNIGTAASGGSGTGAPNYSGGNGAAGSSSSSGGGGGSAGSSSNGGNASNATGGTAGSGTPSGFAGATGVASGNSSSNGNSSAGVGAGGSGGWKGNGGSSSNIGGNGAAGQIILTWTCSGINLTNLNTSAANTCANSNATITVTSNTLATGTYSVYYSLSGANTAANQSTTLSFTSGAPGSGSFTVGGLISSGSTTITIHSIGCATATSGNTANFSVNALPTVNAGSAMTAICQGGTSAALGGSFGGGATSAIWSDGGAGGTFANNTGTTPNTTTYTAAANSGTPVTLTLTTSGGSCGTVSASKPIVVNPSPTVNVGSAMTAICQGGTSASLGGSVGGGATGGAWSTTAGGTFSPGSTDLNATWTPPPAYSGTATLVLTTSGGSCGTVNSSKTIVVNPNPTVNVGGAMTAICQGTTSAALGGSFGGGATSAIWSDGGAGGTFANNTGTTPNTTTYTAAANSGTSVTLTLTSSGGSCGIVSANKLITVNLNPTVNVGSPMTAICQGGTSAALGGSVGGGATGGTWSTSAGGTFNPNATTLNATWTPPPAYSGTATLVLTTSGGSCGTVNSSKTIVVNPTPVLTQPANQAPVCNGSTAPATTFTSSVPGTTFSWTNSNPTIGLAASGTGDVPAFTAVNTGTTDIVATINVTPSANGCAGISRTYTITVYPTPSVTLATPATQTICSASTITSIVFSSNVVGTTFSWDRDNPSGITGTGALLNTSGTGNVTGTFSNSLSSQVSVNFSVTPTYNGCAGASVNNIAEVKTNPVPTVSVSPATQTVCSATSTAILSFAGTGTSYNWTNNNTSIGLAASGTGNIPAFTASNISNTPATAAITVTPVFTADGVICSNGAAQQATYVVNPIPALTSPAPNPSYVCSGSVFNYAPATGVTGNNGGSAFAWTRSVVANISNAAGSGTGSIAETLTNTSSAAVNVTYNYAVSITHNSVTCTNPSSFPVVISVRPTPTVAMTPSTLPDICSGGTMASAITISNPNNLAGTTFAWTRDNTLNVTGAPAFVNDVNIIAASTLVNTTTSTQSTIFTGTATNNACPSSTSVSQLVYAPIGNNTTLPVAVEADICGISKQVTIAPGPATGGSGTYTYQWQMSSPGASNFVDIPGATSADLVLTIPIAEAFFQRIVTSGPCSSVSDKRQVNKPISGGDLYITGSSSSYCQGGDGIDIIISNTVVAATYTLQFNNSGTWIQAPISPNPLVGTGFSMTYPGIKTAGQYRVVAAISGTGGCTQNLNTITVSIDPLPAAPSTNNPAPICNGSSANLVATTSPASVNVNWYADNTTQTPLNGTPINSGTNYSVSPTSTTSYWAASVSSAGCISATRTSATVTVNPLPQMTSANNATICTAGTVSIPFTNDVTGTPSYTWSATDNPNVTGESTTTQTSSTLSNTLSLGAGAVVFQNVVYSVRATVNGCQGPAQTVTVRVDPRPTISNYSVAAICSGNSFSTTPSSVGNTIPTNPATTYTWTAPTGMPPLTGGSAQGAQQTSISQTLTNPTSSSANAIYTVTPAAGACTGNTFTLTVPVNPVPAISTQNTLACSGTAFSFTPLDGAGGNVVPVGTTYSWLVPTGSFLTGLAAGTNQASVNGNLINTSNPAAVQTAVYTVTAASGTCSGSFTVNVAVNPTLKGNITGTYLKCQGTPAVVQVTITGTGNYSGQLSDGTIFSGTAATSPTTISVALAPATIGTVTITQLTNTSTGCVSLAADRTGSATVTALTGTPGVWTGAVSTDWFNCANWANGTVPDNSIDVQIAAGAVNVLVIDPNSSNAPADKIARARNITINKATSFNGAGILYVAGNWQNNLGVAGFNAGAGDVRFMSGTAKQTINTSGTSENFYSLTIANTSNQATSDEVTLQKPVTVAGVFTLVKGRLLTSASNSLTITNDVPAGVDASGAGNDTYVNGPMNWNTSPAGAGSEYTFPVGKPTGPYGAYRPVGVTPYLPVSPGVPQTTTYSSEYFPTAGPGLANRSFLGILQTEHWEIARPAGNLDAVVKLIYIKPSNAGDWLDAGPCSTCNVAIAKQYGGATWNFTNFPSTSSGFDMVKPETRWSGDATGAVYSKLLSNFSPFTFGYDYNIVLGNPQMPVVRIKSFNANLNWSNGELDWNLDGASIVQKVDLEYSADGTNFTKLSSFGPSLYGFYQYTHQQLLAGRHHYRLVVYYNQASKLVSDTRMLELGKLKTVIHELPITVVRTQLMLDINSATSQSFESRILSTNGSLISTQQGLLNPGANKQPVSIPYLSQGLYLIQVRTQDGVSRTMKFMKE